MAKPIDKSVNRVSKEKGKSPVTKRATHVREILHRMGLDPFEGLAEICTKRNSDGDYFYGVEVRVPCLKELAQYVAPKLRAMEHNVSSDGTPLGFQIINFGGMSNGLTNTRNDQQSIESSGHGSIQLPVHVRRTGESQGRKTVEDNSPSDTIDGGSKPKSDSSKRNSKPDDDSGNDDDS